MICASAISGILSAVTLVAAGDGAATLIGTEAAFPPYIFLNDDGSLAGFDRDVGEEACLRAHLDCDWVVAPFDELIPGVMSGRFDMAISGIAVTPEREKLIDFTLPYRSAGGSDYFVGLAGAPAVGDARIGVQSGTIHETHLRKTGRPFRAYRSETALFDALLAGKIDLAYGPFNSKGRAEFFADNGIEMVLEETLPSDGVAMVVCQGNDDLREKLDRAITDMQNDGTLDEMSGRWF